MDTRALHVSACDLSPAHKILHPTQLLEFFFQKQLELWQKVLFIFDSQLQQLVLKLIRSKNQKSIPSFSMVVTKFQYSQVMRLQRSHLHQTSILSLPEHRFYNSYYHEKSSHIQLDLIPIIFKEMCMYMCVKSWHMQTALNSNLCLCITERDRDRDRDREMVTWLAACALRPSIQL